MLADPVCMAIITPSHSPILDSLEKLNTMVLKNTVPSVALVVVFKPLVLHIHVKLC